MMSRIGPQVAGAVLLSALLGFTVFYTSDQAYRRVDALAQGASRAALAQRDFEYLEALVSQWLISLDLLYGHGGAYYGQGATQQALLTEDLMSRLAEGGTIDANDAEEISGFLRAADETSREYTFLPETEVAARGEALRSRSDALTGEIVTWLENASEDTADRLEDLEALAASQRETSKRLTIGSALVYAAVLFSTWLWLSRRLVVPIRRLTDAARRDEPLPPADGIRVAELWSLHEVLRRYVERIRDESRAARRAEAVAKSLTDELESILSTAPSSILTFDSERRVATANRAAEIEFGRAREELIGVSVQCLLKGSEDASDPLIEGSSEIEGLRPDRDAFPCLVAVSAAKGSDGLPRWTVVARDISSERNLELDLRQAQKLEAVGQLAAGIAHEINTPVQFVSDSIQFLEEAFADLGLVLNAYRDAVAAAGLGEETKKSLEQLEEDADLEFVVAEGPAAIKRSLEGLARVASIVKAMKDFAHPGTKTKERSDLNGALETTLTVARSEYKYVAETQLELEEIPPVPCQLSDLNQVFLNLVVNAAHAIEASEGAGKIVVSTRREGDEVIISVSDDGCGIPEDVRDRVFDPFFTTKAVGRGSGQGLAIAYSCVVDRHGGRLWFETELNKGTTFFVALPLEDEL